MNNHYWSTEDWHYDNKVTMGDFLENQLSEEFEILMVDGTYAEIENKETCKKYEVHVSGNGDPFEHKAEFKEIDQTSKN